jgi:peroxiredoxin
MKFFNLDKITLFVGLTLLFSPLSQAGELTEKLKAKSDAGKAKRPKEVTQIMQKGLDDLRALGLHKKAIGVDKKAPPVNFKNLNGKRVSLSDYYEEGPLVLTFYRGGWCPYCMLELDAYQKMLGKFKKAGAKVLAVSPDSIKEATKTKGKRNLEFDVVTDPENRAAKLFGLAFKVDPGTLKIYQKFGINLKASQGNDNNELPMPGTYIIDKTGKIRYSFVDPDYTKRADPEEVLEVLRGL